MPQAAASPTSAADEMRLQQLEQVLEQSGESIVVKDLNAVVTFWNREATALFGFSAAEALGRPLRELHAADLSDADYALLLERIRGGVPTTSTVERRRKSGEVVQVLIKTTPLVDPCGRLIGEITIARDVTAARLAEAAVLETQTRLASIVETAMDAIVSVDEQMRIRLFNPAAERIFGYEEREILGERLDRLIPARFRMAHAQHIARFAQMEDPSGAQPSLSKLCGLKSDGTEFLMEASISKADVGGRRSFTAILRDVTARKQAESALRESEMRLRAVIEQSPISIAFARDGVTVDVNDVYLRTFGFDSVEEVRDRPLLDQIAPQCRAEVEERIQRRMRENPVDGNYESVGLRRDGTQFPVFISAKRLVFQDGPLTIAFLIDISRQKASEEEIRHLAFYDQLTDLPNRRLLQDRLGHAMGASARNGKFGALLYIDLDDFKSLNDTLGHSVGDTLLQFVALRLRACVREGDTIARMGGDEFVVILEGLGQQVFAAAQQVESIASKILAALRPPYQLATHEYHCTASIGATMFRGREEADVELIKQADIAMYAAKRAGRSGVRFFDPKMQDAINAQAAVVGELHQAIESGQFCLHYQIQVDSERRPFGAEALIRWNHPARGLVSPAQFISLAERSEMILPIGLWVLETACRQLRQWSGDRRTRGLALCVNVSARQFHGGNFVETVRDCVHRFEIDPELLVLELTESLLLEDIEDTIATMHALRQVGVHFSLDDFGTGYSSLQYLKRLPLHQLKIDQSFVRDIAVDRNDHEIVQTIVSMAKNLNLRVIAEGVETEEQWSLLRAMGCREFQGFLFGRPVPIDEFEAVREYLAGQE